MVLNWILKSHVSGLKYRKNPRDFATNDNVIGMLCVIIFGVAFTAILGSLVVNVINPSIGLFMGCFASAGLSVSIEDPTSTYCNLIMAIIRLLIIVSFIFTLVRQVNTIRKGPQSLRAF